MRSGKTSLDALGLSLLSSCPLPNPARAIQSYWRGTITALGLLAPVQSCFWKAAATATYPSEIPHCPPLQPHRSGYFSHTLSNVRGRLRPPVGEASAVILI